MNDVPASDSLGSLSQAARSNQLKSARSILIAVGILTLIGNLIFFLAAEAAVDAAFKPELDALRAKGLDIDQEKLAELREQAIRETRLVNGVGLAIGFVFIILGANVKKYPVPITITGLVLYIGCAAAFGLMDPASLAKGWLFKIFIVAGLVKAVQAAIAYEKEESAATKDAPLTPFA